MTTKKLAKKLRVLDPTTEPKPMSAVMAQRADTLDGKVIGILDNGKHNADKILALVEKALAKRYNLAGVVTKRKRDASKPASQDILDEMAEECQVAIVGVGD